MLHGLGYGIQVLRRLRRPSVITEKFYATLASPGRFKTAFSVGSPIWYSGHIFILWWLSSRTPWLNAKLFGWCPNIKWLRLHEPNSAASSASNPTVAESVGKSIVSQLRDGTVLCKAFQTRRCRVSGRACDAGQHCLWPPAEGRSCLWQLPTHWQSMQQQAED